LYKEGIEALISGPIKEEEEEEEVEFKRRGPYSQ
jgi:hypothetical protein